MCFPLSFCLVWAWPLLIDAEADGCQICRQGRYLKLTPWVMTEETEQNWG